jgi:hypothetical protein
VDAGPPWFSGPTSWEVVDAQPPDELAKNRHVVSISLNFEIPLAQVSGLVAIHAKVWVEGHQGDTGPYSASETISVTFLNQPTQEILPYLIEDPHLGLPAPNMSDYYSTMRGAITRFPVAEDGFICNPPIRRALQPWIDLRTDLGWLNLVLQLATEMFIFPNTPVGGIRAALVPDVPYGVYPWDGLGLPTILGSIPSFAVQAGSRVGYAHEMGHTFGIHHAMCGNPGWPHDSRLPAAIEDTGMDVAAQSTVARGTHELMTYCGGDSRWPSIAFWDIAFDTLPI